MTALDISFLFSGSKNNDIRFSASNMRFKFKLIITYYLQLFGNFISWILRSDFSLTLLVFPKYEQ